MDRSSLRLHGNVRLLGGDEHRHAARRLTEAWRGVNLLSAADGDVETNGTVRLVADTSIPEGAFTIETAVSGSSPEIVVRGGPFSGVIYGVEEMVARRSASSDDAVDVESGTVTAEPGLPYRTFWTWDHTTNWDLEQIGVQEIGVVHPYSKPPEGFLADYKRMVDFMSRHRIAAVVIFGFFRDSHGGIEAAQELCRYANERGVRILPGVAINAYGGVYWEGEHPYNLATWLRRHPELTATLERPVGFQLRDLGFPLNFPRSDYTVSGCPSQPENLRWMEEGIAWLAETVDIGGVNIESGDYGVCGCPRCAARRAEREDARRRDGYAESWSHADMADFYPRLYEAATSRRNDLWLYSELQWDNLLDPVSHASLRALPDAGIYQHTLNRSYWNRVRAELTPEYVRALPTQRNVFRAQFACQWNGDVRTERYRFNGRDFAELSWKAAECGLQGLTVWGEPSPYIPPVELSYLAFARFTYEPSLTWEAFLREEVEPRLGGEVAARRYLEIVGEIDQADALGDTVWRSRRDEALEAARGVDDEASRRWTWLADRIDRHRYNAASRP